MNEFRYRFYFSAGVGRSGTFIALDLLLESEQTTIDLLQFTHQMRCDAFSFQTSQYPCGTRDSARNTANEESLKSKRDGPESRERLRIENKTKKYASGPKYN